jgi:hypothetical protein
MERTHETLKDAVNRVLRAGLASQDSAVNDKTPFKVEAHPCDFLPGFDRDKMNQLADELEAEEFVGRRSQQDGS